MLHNRLTITIFLTMIFILLDVYTFGQTKQQATENLRNMPGEELVKLLLDESLRERVYYELHLRAEETSPEELEKKSAVDFDEFIKHHGTPQVVVCPQEKGVSPIYLVLYLFDGEPPESFPKPGSLEVWNNVVIEAFTSTGKRITPFEGNNLLHNEILTDMNGDGLIERGGCTSYGFEEKGVQFAAHVLEVNSVLEKARPIFAVVLDLGHNEEWGYEFTDRDKDGFVEIEIGPCIENGIMSKVVYRWDKDKKEYTGPNGKEGDHFRVIDATRMFEELKRLKEEGVSFPKDPDAIPYIERIWMHTKRHRSPKIPPSPPYKYTSLKNLTNEEIVRYMGEGKNIQQLERESIIPNQIPKDFWSSKPKDVALATADVNRTPNHRKVFRLSVNDSDNPCPPERCSVLYSYFSDNSYNAVICHFFLRVDPLGSYLAYARSWEPGVVFAHIYAYPVYNLRYCELEYVEARQFAHVIWWLSRVRTGKSGKSDSNGFGGMFSTADGRGSLKFILNNGKTSISVKGIIWYDETSERWHDDYSSEVYLNLTDYLIIDVLTEHLGKRWRLFNPGQSQDWIFSPVTSPEHIQRLRQMAGKFLSLYTLDQRYISFPIVEQAARVTGNFVFQEFAPKVQEIASRPPVFDKPVRSPEEIKKEIEMLMKEGSETGKNVYDKVHSLIEDFNKSRLDINERERLEGFKNVLALAHRQIQAADNIQALKEWACSKNPGFQWALEQLSKKDQSSYLEALEWWLKNTKGKLTKQVFDVIAKTNPERAYELAKQLPPEQKKDVAVSAFSLVEEAQKVQPDEEKRVEALIEAMLDPKTDWKDRGKAVEYLVPPDNPWKYPYIQIDEALLKLLNPRLADETINFTMTKACRALAFRSGAKHFDAVLAQLDPEKSEYEELISAITHMAQIGGKDCQAKLAVCLQQSFDKTYGRMNHIIWSAWAADLRTLKPDIERIATSGPDDIEGDEGLSWSNKPSKVLSRYHIARKIAAIWNEEDAVTRGKLLIAFGFYEPYYMGESDEIERVQRMKIELEELIKKLNPQQRNEIASFLEWYEQKHIVSEKGKIWQDYEKIFRDWKTKFSDKVRDILNMTNQQSERK